MDSNAQPRKLLGWLVFVLWISPFLILLAHVTSLKIPSADRLIPVLQFTLLQSVLSAIGSVFFGTLGALGILSLASRPASERAGRMLTIFPNVLPTLFVLLATLNLLPQARGLFGIVFIHILLNTGLVATVLAEILASRIGRMAELAWIEGSGRIRFLTKVVLPLVKTDFWRLGFFVFSLCMTSFAVPLVIGGSRATTLEVLIYENIRISLDWSQAVTLALLQSLIVLVIAWTLRRNRSTALAPVRPVPLLQWRLGLTFAWFPTVFLSAGLILPLPNAIGQLRELALFTHGQLGALLGGSILVGLLTGLFTMAFLFALLHARPKGVQSKVLLGVLAPSSVLTGFALLLFWRSGGLASLIKISLGLSLIAVPAFYRLYWESLIESLQPQIAIAETLGASDWKITNRILLPQALQMGMFLAGLSAFWAWGDFALSSVVAESSLTLAMIAQDLMSSYRLPAATVMVWVVLLGGGLTFFAFWGAGRVLGNRSKI